MSRLDDSIANVAHILDSLIALRSIENCGNCNDCKMAHNGCPYVPKPGQMVRYNCPLYMTREVEE